MRGLESTEMPSLYLGFQSIACLSGMSVCCVECSGDIRFSHRFIVDVCHRGDNCRVQEIMATSTIMCLFLDFIFPIRLESNESYRSRQSSGKPYLDYMNLVWLPGPLENVKMIWSHH